MSTSHASMTSPVRNHQHHQESAEKSALLRRRHLDVRQIGTALAFTILSKFPKNPNLQKFGASRLMIWDDLAVSGKKGKMSSIQRMYSFGAASRVLAPKIR
jgi:hypothetical protein